MGADGAPCMGLEHLPPDLASPAPSTPAEGAPPADRLDEVQLHAIRRALDATAGNVSAAARRLGVARSTIYRMLRRED